MDRRERGDIRNRGRPGPPGQPRGGPYRQQGPSDYQHPQGRSEFRSYGGPPDPYGASFDARYSGGPPPPRYGGPPDSRRGGPPDPRRGDGHFDVRYASGPDRTRYTGPPPGPRQTWVDDRRGGPSGGGGDQYRGDSRSLRPLGRGGYSSVKPPGPEHPVTSARGDDTGDGQSSASQKKIRAKPSADNLVEQMERVTITEGLHPPCRPDNGGTLGEPVLIRLNCWDMTIADRTVLMYDIEALQVYRMRDNEKVEVRLLPKDMRALLKHIVKRMPSDTVYDGGRIIYKLDPLPGVTEMGIQKEDPVPDPTDRDELTLKYRIKLVQETSTGDLARYVENPRASTLAMPQESIRMIDCIFKSINEDKFVSSGRAAIFYPTPIRRLADKLFDIHMGFITSVRPQWKVRVNVDMTCKAFFPPGNLADVLYSKYGDDIENPACWNSVLADIKRLRVEAKFYKNQDGKSFSRRFTVFSLSTTSAQRLIIEDKNESVFEYFKEHHNITLQYPGLPCVKVSNKRDVFIPMELLHVLPYQNPTARKADVASEIIRCAAVKPQERFRELDRYVGEFMRHQHSLFKHYEINVQTQRGTVSARVLPQPCASFGGRDVELGRGKWMANTFLQPATAEPLKWAVVNIPPHNAAQRNQATLVQRLPQAAAQFGFRFDPRPFCKTITSSELEGLMRQLHAQRVTLVVLVLYDNFTYPSIKMISDIKLGIRTQCVKGVTLTKPNVFPNLMLKINGKLGGINWSVSNYPIKGSVMVFGADVTHPAPTQNDELRKSVAAVLGSITPDLMRYAAVVRRQDTTERGNKTTREIIDNMEEIVSDLLKAYFVNNNDRFPDRLIFYRDGVSEGQFDIVLTGELPAIQRACAGLRAGYEPAITYIVVQKRHHIRFEPLDQRAKNVAPGTVVDTVITHRREFDFYLCSQEGIQGTSKPAHYHVLYDDSNWTSDSLQMFTYFLCHAYMRCPRSVSYPAPTYYSHLAAFRARDWLAAVNEQPDNFITKNRFKVHDSQFTGMFFL
ncbi:hypothetical protein AAHC03_09753 [Spirometra sp. Aus1]